MSEISACSDTRRLLERGLDGSEQAEQTGGQVITEGFFWNEPQPEQVSPQILSGPVGVE